MIQRKCGADLRKSAVERVGISLQKSQGPILERHLRVVVFFPGCERMPLTIGATQGCFASSKAVGREKGTP